MKHMDFDRFREAGRIAAEARELGRSLIRPGVLLREVVEACEARIRERGGEPAFPAQISRNHVAAHYCPPPDDETRIETDDILKLDLGVHLEGHIADTALTVDLRDGEDSPLSTASRMALENVLAMIGPGVALREIGRTIHDTIQALGFKPVFNLTGHGVARWQVHCAPQIPNYDDRRSGHLRPGQVVAIEPFASDGKGYIDEVGAPEVFQQSRPLRPRDKLPEELVRFLEDLHRLPFARRDLRRRMSARDAERGLALLKKRRLLVEYPPLAERPGTRISQHEHTILILEDGAEPTTKVA